MSEPFISDKKGWPKIRLTNTRSRAPWGYHRNPEDKFEFLPDMELIMLAEKAMDFLDQGQSLRLTADWLATESGSPCSHMTLSNMWKRNRGKEKSVRTKKLAQRRKNERARTKDEKEAIHIVRRKAAAKRTLSMMDKKEKALLEGEIVPDNGIILPAQAPIEDFVSETYDEPVDRPDIVFKPNPGPQTQFLAASERVVLYGGSAGGGKSYALLADPLRYLGNKNFSGIIFRRTIDELRDLIAEADTLYKAAYPGTRWLEKKSMFLFPSGARMWMTYLEDDRDVKRYVGQAFCWIGWDELTHQPSPYAFDFMMSRNRTTDPTLPTLVRATTNPGSIGHAWVKRRFIDPAPANQAFWAKDDATGKTLAYPETYPLGHPLAGQPHAKAGKPLYKYRFIPAFLYDNPYLLQDSSYEAALMAMPEQQRRQLLEGDWNIAEGAAFSEFREHIHVCKPFELDPSWLRYRSCDFGYSSHSAVHWFAYDKQYDTLYVYRELYLSKHTGRDLARAVLAAERGENINYGVLDSSVWHQRGQTGPSIAEEMIAEGCRWRRADRSAGSRSNGKNEFHERLKVRDFGDGKQIPGIVFFDTCRQIIKDLPVIPSDPRGTDDIDPRYADDHAYDSVRYGIMSRPKSRSQFDFGSTNNSDYHVSDSSFGY